MSDRDELIRTLGRTQTVRDAETAYRQIFEARRKFEVLRRQAKDNVERRKAEIRVFIDDLVAITGLPIESPLFREILAMTLAARLRRHHVVQEEMEYRDLCGLEELP